MGKRITQARFHKINRDLKAGLAVDKIMGLNNVSRETVRNVRLSKTWPGFLLRKQQKSSYIANAKDRKFHQAQKAGLKPVRPAFNRKVEQLLTLDLKETGDFVTRDEFESAIHLLNERIDVHAFTIKQKADKKQHWWRRY